MESVQIIDRIFAHSKYSSLQDSSKFIWTRNVIDKDTVVVVTELDILTSNHTNMYGWIVESPMMYPNIISQLDTVKHKYKKIFTSNKSLIEKGDPFYFIPLGGCWISPDTQKIYNKTRDISIIASAKRNLEGHKLRHCVISQFENKLAVMGGGYKHIDNKLEGHKNFRFSIVIENCKQDYYFTEKLIDCFATGCIPIYWGCPSIHTFFNMDGLITFNDIIELDTILPTLTKELYDNKMDAIKDNFERSKEFMIADDKIYNFIKTNTV